MAAPAGGLNVAAPGRSGTRSASARSASPRAAATRRTGARKSAAKTPAAERNAAPGRSDFALLNFAQDLRGWADNILAAARPGMNLAGALAKPFLAGAVGSVVGEKNATRAGAMLKDLRETAGLSLKDLGTAINLSDAGLIEKYESGQAAIPFEIILRMAAVLARNDPLPFVLNMVRTSNPSLARTLENLGVGRLLEHAGREREFINLYRSNDALRALSDEEFAALLGFLSGAIDLALTHREGNGSGGRKARPGIKQRG
ncbi:MAG: helix-turn-helix transcriptional regulator [Burkholderiales bacterium]|nr:helix-turn-helix transcriptional regulator [Burkholderiales bacterium]